MGTISHRALVEILGFIAAALIIAYIGHNWMGDHDARLIAEQQTAAQKQIAAQMATANAELAKERDDTAQALKDATAKLGAQRAAAVTPDQLTQLIAQFTGLKPTIVAVPSATPGAAPTQIATLPASDLSKIADLATACQQCKLDLTAAQGENASLKQTVANDAQQLTAAQKEAKDWETAAKGGNFWSKLKHDSKVIAITALTAGAIGYAAAHR
jgi:hypothetical protein